jgi:hypothetical protein
MKYYNTTMFGVNGGVFASASLALIKHRLTVPLEVLDVFVISL